MGWNPLKDLDRMLGSPLGISNADEAKKANEANLGKIGGLYQGAQQQFGQDYYRAIGTQKRATAAVRAGVDAGRLNIATMGDKTRQGIIDRASQGLDASQMGQEGRGIYSKALADSARRSNAYDVNSALGAVDEAIARLASQYEVQGGAMIGSALGQESEAQRGLASGRSSMTQNYMDILGGVQHTAAPGWGIELAKAIASSQKGG